MTEAISDGVAVIDENGRVRRSNECLARILGRPVGELIGAEVSQLWEKLPGTDHPFARAIESRRRETIEFDYNGKRLHLMAGKFPAGANRQVWTQTFVSNIQQAADALAGDGIDVMLELATLPETTAMVQMPTTIITTTRTDDAGFAAFAHPIDTDTSTTTSRATRQRARKSHRPPRLERAASASVAQRARAREQRTSQTG